MHVSIVSVANKHCCVLITVSDPSGHDDSPMQSQDQLGWQRDQLSWPSDVPLPACLPATTQFADFKVGSCCSVFLVLVLTSFNSFVIKNIPDQ